MADTVAEKPYKAEHVVVKNEQYLSRTEDVKPWRDKYAARVACQESGQMSAINVPYKELGQVVLETGDLITGTLQDSLPEDVSILSAILFDYCDSYKLDKQTSNFCCRGTLLSGRFKADTTFMSNVSSVPENFCSPFTIALISHHVSLITSAVSDVGALIFY